MKKSMLSIIKSNLHLFLFSLTALIIIIPIFQDKYIFSLDLFPRVNNLDLINLFYGKTASEHGGVLPFLLLSSLIPPQIFQKIFLFLILFLSGVSAYNLVPLNSKPAKFFAGLLYMLNPYTFVRIVAGHWLILFSYAVLPFAIKAFMELLEDNSKRKIAKVTFLTTIVGFSAHILVITFLAYSVIFLFMFHYKKNAGMLKSLALVFSLYLLLNAYWLIPVTTAEETYISRISSEDLAAFAPRIESFSALFTLASMHGFWRAGYVYAKDFIPHWQVLFAFILFLAVHGFISYYKNEKVGIYVKSLGIIAILGLILAAGIRSPFEEFFRFLFDHVPLIKGMRDSHKFIALLVLAYAYLGAFGVYHIEKGIKRGSKTGYFSILLIGLAIVTPLVYSFTFFNGFAGQIKSTDFPPDWYEINEFLNQNEEEFNVLFLPWHLHMDYRWNLNKDKRVANYIQLFFDKPVISGRNIEIGKIYRQVYTPDQVYVDFILQNRNKINNFGELVSILNVKYVLLTKEADYENYFFLFNQSDLSLVKETENFYVFKNKHEAVKIYGVNSIAYVKDWNELLERSKSEDITKKVYLFGNKSSDNIQTPEKNPLGYEKKNPVKYVLKDISKKYIVFTEPYSKSWQLGDKAPLKGYGVVNAYELDKVNSKEIKYQRFYAVYLPSYIISLLTFLALIAIYFDFHKRTVRFRRKD